MRSDSDLVTAVLAGERSAYAELVQRYERAVHAAAMEILRNHHSAQDVAQEAFVTAYRKLGSLHEGAAFGGWVLRIARRLAVRATRQRIRPVPIESSGDVPAQQRNGRLDETSEMLLKHVLRLPEQERVAVMLRYFSSRSVQEIAEATRRPVGTVTKQLSRAHERLREWLRGVEL